MKDYNEALLFFVENKENADIITYNKVDIFSLLSVDVLRIGKQHYYYEYSVDRTGDIIDNIRFESSNKNIRINYYIGGYKYEPSEVKEFILVSAPYTDFKIRITFLEKPSNEDEFSIHSRVYLLDTEYRKKMARNTVITNTNIYKDGICAKLNNFTRNGGSLEEYKAYVDDI